MSISGLKGNFIRNLRGLSRWFKPGLGVKRWFLLVLLGITFLGVGLALFLLEIYRTQSTNNILLTGLFYASLSFLPRELRIFIFAGLGVGLVTYGILRLNHTLLGPFIRPGHTVVDELASFRQRERGPRSVAISGGHGLSTLLRGLKTYTNKLTAIVTVADDGGASGRLRESFGILPPGDIRNCLAALSNDEQMLAEAHNNLGNVLAARQDHRGALASYTRATEIDPRHALAHYNRGNALHALGELEACGWCLRGSAASAAPVLRDPGESG